MNIGFFCRHFTERGTEVSVYNYAKYNEEILGNKSYIICFTTQKQKDMKFPLTRVSYSKFKERFDILEITDISNMKEIIKKTNLTHFFTRSDGRPDIYKFDDKAIWGNCKTIYQCVFHTKYPQGDVYCSIGSHLNVKNNTNIPVLPGHMLESSKYQESLRDKLNIPQNAIVIGRHGGNSTFDIKYVHECIKKLINNREDIYFLFLNTDKFHQHKHLIYLDKTINDNEKQAFINTCDAMIHARSDGETFGAAVAEFSVSNKPVITCNCGDLEHIRILGDKGIIYNNKEELMHIFKNVELIISSKQDWNAYQDYSPYEVMKKFKSICLD
jgi:hypothetical protein